MVILIKNAEVYAPEKLGRKDVLVLDQHIAAIRDNLKVDFGGAVPVTEVDGTDMVLTPGFIDSHVHVLGGGGEGGLLPVPQKLCLLTLPPVGLLPYAD